MLNTRNADDLIQELNLIQHPEGGWFRETYRSPVEVAASELPAGYRGGRRLGTSIYFLLKEGERSHWHRLVSDELWYYHGGRGVRLYLLDSDGRLEVKQLGAGADFQLVIPAGCWFAAELDTDVGLGDFGLVGCVVLPGFEFEDFELGTREQLLSAYPQHAELVRKFTSGE